MSFELPKLQRAAAHSTTVLRADAPPFSPAAAAALKIATAALPAVPAPTPKPMSLRESNTRQISFIPTIDGAYPLRKAKRIYTVDFPDVESAKTYFKALLEVHKKLIDPSKARAIFDRTKSYNNDILGNRDIDPVVFIFKAQGSPLKAPAPIHTADFHNPAEAYSYTNRLLKAHQTLAKAYAQQRAPIPAVPDEISQSARGPGAEARVYSRSSSHTSIPVAALAFPLPPSSSQPSLSPTNANTDSSTSAHAAQKMAEFDEKDSYYAMAEFYEKDSHYAQAALKMAKFAEKDSGYTIDEDTDIDGRQMFMEKWPIGGQEPPPIPNSVDHLNRSDDHYNYRISVIPSPSAPPLSSASSLTPPRFPLPLPNGAIAPSCVTEVVEKDLGEGVVNVLQTWPAGQPDPDLPDGHFSTNSKEQLNGLILKRSTCLRVPS